MPRKRSSRAPKADGESILATLPKQVTETAADEETLEFLQAIDAWKRSSGRQFPSWSEVLGILKRLGYVKTG